MATFLGDDVREEVRSRLRALDHPVRLIFFTEKHACGGCRDQRQILDELVSLSGKLQLEVHELTEAREEAKRYGIDKVPATVVLSDVDRGLRFFGMTGGYEFVSLLESILMVSSGESGLDPGVNALAGRIREPLHLEVMVTLSCPYCPGMVHVAHQLAMANEHIRADMVDAAEFPALTQRYDVTGVPRTVINGRPAFVGALAPQAAVMEILKNIDPEEYERADASTRESKGERKIREAHPGEIYDVLVVGAGPAGLSATLYAARKNRRVALIGKKAGGQINDTALIDNWLGLPEISGQELAEMFRNHVETYAVFERCHTQVARVRRGNDEVLEAETEDGAVYRGRTLIYAAGKQYRRLGIPGEERFIGRGIAFCATCDAPLYQGKRVAVVGGGNSAFTATRDLLSYAREIHVIHMLSDFQADPMLVDEIRAAKNVTFHLEAEAREFLGDERLAAVRVGPVGGTQGFDLAIDGVFLEIGLVPNTAPITELVRLNTANEVTVGRHQETEVPGLFAAGDVTDEMEKQIVVAAGAGARAALAADRYLASLGVAATTSHAAD